MGVNLMMIAGHGIPVDEFPQLAARLTGPPRAFDRVHDSFVAMGWSKSEDWTWESELSTIQLSFAEHWKDSHELEIFRNGKHGRIEGLPSIRAYERAMVLCAGKHWHRFCDPEGEGWRGIFRTVGREFAAIGAGNRVIYIPDSSFGASRGWDFASDGASLDEVERLLRNHCGSPLLLNEVTDDNVELPFEGWFVEAEM